MSKIICTYFFIFTVIFFFPRSVRGTKTKHHTTSNLEKSSLKSIKIIPEMEKKCAAIKIPRSYTLERALISLYGPDEALRNSCYFNRHVTGKDIIASD
jgi:hypothetical protein